MTDNKQQYLNSLTEEEKKRYYKIAIKVANLKKAVEQDQKVRKHHARNWSNSNKRKEVRVYNLDI